jgi:hypothetical protein
MNPATDLIPVNIPRGLAAIAVKPPAMRNAPSFAASGIESSLSRLQSPGERPVNRGAAAIENDGYIVRVLALAAEFLRMFDLFRGQARLPSGFDAPRSRGLHSGACPFDNQTPSKLGKQGYHLPHGAACRRVGVDCLCERAEFHAAFFQVVEHGITTSVHRVSSH